MIKSDLSLREDYWETLEITEADINYLYNYLIELERPMPIRDLAQALIHSRINQIKESLEKRQEHAEKVYLPKESYEIGETLIFPAIEWSRGKIVGKRPGVNPEVPPFDVIDVALEDGVTRSFASGVEEHVLNNPVEVSVESDAADADAILSQYGESIASKLRDEIFENPDLIAIADKWFPKALLVDVNIGYLNLAEALLDMEGGGPLTTDAILKQIDLPTDVNPELTAFSLDYAMNEDDRFDEVGATGEVVWYLNRLEPEWVQNKPVYLQYQAIEYNEEEIQALKGSLSRTIIDDLEMLQDTAASSDDVTLSLIYPHWRSGSLPLAPEITHLFPTALLSPRVQFTFVDGDTGKRFSGWVVRPNHYIGGLSEWFEEQGVIPGSLIQLHKGERMGEVIINVNRRRSAREWVRTALASADGGLVFAMLKQLVSTDIDERTAVFVPDVELLDKQWSRNKTGKYELTRILIHMMTELVKLNPQGHVHLEELYAAVNLRFRCPPGLLLSILMENPWASHMGDLYFNLNREHLDKSK